MLLDIRAREIKDGDYQILGHKFELENITINYRPKNVEWKNEVLPRRRTA